MIEKIILTVEQNEAIKSWKSRFGSNEKLLGGHALSVLTTYSQWSYEFQSLTDLSIDQMARILYETGSYEVEQPKFEVGEWVTRTEGASLVISNSLINKNRRNARTFKIVKLYDKETVEDFDGVKHNIRYLRKSTTEEAFSLNWDVSIKHLS